MQDFKKVGVSDKKMVYRQEPDSPITPFGQAVEDEDAEDVNDVPITYVRTIQPTQPEFAVVTLTTNEWVKITDWKTADVATWSIHNRGVQDIQYSYWENPGYQRYTRLSADVKDSQDTVPPELWVRRTSAASEPVVVVEYWLY